eukprot:Tamp_31845.p2 GENE.Tamp_31845~~Tamp_31845.p2  ORF type:complete len:100 (+),score=4.00 Tamp_31845:126-425(+)
MRSHGMRGVTKLGARAACPCLRVPARLLACCMSVSSRPCTTYQGVNWWMLSPMIWAPTIPLTRIAFRNNPAVRDKAFALAVACAFFHGLTMWPAKGTDV